MRFDGKMPFDPESLYSLSLRRFGGLLYFDVAWDSSLGNPCTATRNFRGITLPEHVCNALITHFSSRRRAFREMLLLFSDPQLCRVTQANLRIPPDFARDSHVEPGLSVDLTDSAVAILDQHSLTDIDLSYRTHATGWSLASLAPRSSQSLKKLSMVGCGKYDDFKAIGKFENIRILNLSRCRISDESLQFVCEQLKHLSELDLSRCQTLKSMHGLALLSGVLASLTLYGCRHTEDSMKTLLKMIGLRHLDISCTPNEPFAFLIPGMNPGQQIVSSHIREIVEHLPNLQSFDISGTELNNDTVSCLETRRDKLEFLGLCLVQGVPSHEWAGRQANMIASELEVEQIVNGLQRYIMRPQYTQRLLHRLYQCLNDGEVDRRFLKPAFNIVVKVADTNRKDNRVLLSGTAAMYHLVRQRGYRDQDPCTMNALTKLLLQTIEDDDGSPPMRHIVRNCLLILLQYLGEPSLADPFREQVIRSALTYVENSGDTSLTHIATLVIYNLGCSTTTEQKTQLRETGAVKEIIALVTRKKQANEFDDTIDTATGFLWNITDECPPNCKEFVDCNGMDLFISVYENGHDARAVIRNLLGLLGNVAEVPSLRHHFIRDDVITALVKLLESEDEGIEISYNTCGILSHIGTDGPEAWKVTVVSQEDVFTAMETAVRRWDIDAERSINYHSLEPLLRVIKSKNCPSAQLWAVWALANLTNVSSGKYCLMVKKEGGIPLLREILDDLSEGKMMKELAGRTLAVCDLLSQEKGLW